MSMMRTRPIQPAATGLVLVATTGAVYRCGLEIIGYYDVKLSRLDISNTYLIPAFWHQKLKELIMFDNFFFTTSLAPEMETPLWPDNQMPGSQNKEKLERLLRFYNKCNIVIMRIRIQKSSFSGIKL